MILHLALTMLDMYNLMYCAICSFALSLIAIVLYLKMGGVGLWRDDINKPVKRKVLTAGGIPVLIVLCGSYIYLGLAFKAELKLFHGLVLATIMAMVIGYIDDVYDIKVWKKVPLMLIPPIPLVIMSLPDPLWNHTTVFGIDFGVLYWLLIIPIVYMGFSNGANIIAGYDGLEGGVYILILILYIFIGFISKNDIVLYLSIPLLAVISAFEIFNLPPSKLLLGNVGSFSIGGILGIIPLAGNFEVVLPIIFLPHLIEFFFKIRYKGETSVFGVVDEKGIIHNKDGIKSVIHWVISWGNMTEKKITAVMLSIEAILCVVAFFVWYLL